MGGAPDRDPRTGALTHAQLSEPFVRHVFPLALTLVIAAGPLAAQDTTTTPAPVPAAPRCNGETVSAVTVDRGEPVMVERSAGWARPILRFALAGAPTRESAVVPFLLIKQGDKCTELLLSESERVLRQQPYLADARAVAVPDTNGTVRVEFSTTDDIRPVLGLGVKESRPTRIKIGSGNVAGYGMAAAVQWQQGFAFRDGFSAKYTNYHTFGQPLLLDTQLERSPLGEIVSASLSRPLYSRLSTSKDTSTVSPGLKVPRSILSPQTAMHIFLG